MGRGRSGEGEGEEWGRWKRVKEGPPPQYLTGNTVPAMVMTLLLTASARTKESLAKARHVGRSNKWGKGYYKGGVHFYSACVSAPTSAIAAGHSAVLP